jgi:hypothetical protein
VIRLQAEQPDVANAGAYRFRPETRPSQANEAIESDDSLRSLLPAVVLRAANNGKQAPSFSYVRRIKGGSEPAKIGAAKNS